MQAANREVAATLDANGVEYLVLKGFTQAPDFVPRPELRWQGDIDFYVPREHVPAAVRALHQIGYASCHPEDCYQHADHVPTLVRFGAWKWNGNVYDSVSSIAIPEIEQFCERRRFRRLGDLTFPALHPVDHMGYFAMHILRGIFGAEGPVHHVRELGVFHDRRPSDDAFWREWTVMPRQRSLLARRRPHHYTSAPK